MLLYSDIRRIPTEFGPILDLVDHTAMNWTFDWIEKLSRIKNAIRTLQFIRRLNRAVELIDNGKRNISHFCSAATKFKYWHMVDKQWKIRVSQRQPINIQLCNLVFGILKLQISLIIRCDLQCTMYAVQCTMHAITQIWYCQKYENRINIKQTNFFGFVFDSFWVCSMWCLDLICYFENYACRMPPYTIVLIERLLVFRYLPPLSMNVFINPQINEWSFHIHDEISLIFAYDYFFWEKILFVFPRYCMSFIWNWNL